VLINGVDERLKDILRQTAAEFQALGIELEVTPALACGASVPDHVPLLCEVDPHFGLHRLVKSLKGRSARRLRLEFPWLRPRLPTVWIHSYILSIVGGAPLLVIKPNGESQKDA
jgi:putative transposase